MANEKNIIRGFRDENGNTAKYAFSALAEIPEEFEADKIQSTVNDIKETKKLANETKENLEDNYYNKSQVDNKINNLEISDEKLQSYYNKTETDTKIIDYTSENFYNKGEIDTKLSSFSPDNVYTKTEADSTFAQKTELETVVEHVKELPISTFENDAKYVTEENAATKADIETIKSDVQSDLNDLNITYSNQAWKDLGPFKINGEIVNPVNGIVSLPANKQSLELSGYLRGCIEIGREVYGEENGGNGIKLTLNNVYIDSPYTSGIVYLASKKKMSIKLEDNSKNYIYCGSKDIFGMDKETTDFRGAIYSFNNMQISGVGSLTIENIKGSAGLGHGIKASELEIIGRPNIYVKANHDAFHAGKKLIAGNGVFTVEKANDAFGTGDNGYILVFGGVYNLSGITSGQNCFDSNQKGYILAEREKFNINTDTAEANIYKNMNFIDDSDFASSFGTPKIEYYTVTEAGGEEIETLISPAITSFPETQYTISTDDQYISINSKGKKEITIYVYGNFANKEIVVPANTTDLTISKINVKLINAIVGKISSSDGTKVKLYDLEDESKVNVFYNNSESPVNLGDDLNINTDCPIVIIGNSTVASVNCSELALKGDGYKHIENLYDGSDVFSAQGSLIYIGGDEDGASKNSAGGIYIKKLHSRLTSKGKKGTIIIYSIQDNDVILENISAATSATNEGNAYVVNDVEENVTGFKKLYLTNNAVNNYNSKSENIIKKIKEIKDKNIILADALTEFEYEKIKTNESNLKLIYSAEFGKIEAMFVTNSNTNFMNNIDFISSEVNANTIFGTAYGTLTICKNDLSKIIYIPYTNINLSTNETFDGQEVLKSIEYDGYPALNQSYRIFRMTYNTESKLFVTNSDLIDFVYSNNAYGCGESFETRLALTDNNTYSIFSGLNSIGTGMIYDTSTNKVTYITIKHIRDTNVSVDHYMKMELHAYQDGTDITDEFVSTKLSNVSTGGAVEVYAL